jgi:hypothetical protein
MKSSCNKLDTGMVPQSQLKYTTSLLGVGCIPMDILGVPVVQFGAQENSSVAPKLSSLSSGADLFKLADFLSQELKCT